MQPLARPKRRYTVTTKVLAACRANLLKANAVAHEIRFRRTPRRLRACHANLLRAQAAMRSAEAPSRAYGACFRHGLYAVSLRRSAALAGESQAEFDANLRRFERAFAPQDGVEGKLVRALARASWRRLRALRGQANWELRSLEYRLAEAAPGYPSDEFWRPSPAACDQMLVDEVLGILGTSLSLYTTLPKLSGRVERLLWALLEKQTGEAPEFTWFMHRRGSLATLLARPEAALDNPFLSSGLVAEALGPRPLSVQGTRRWMWSEMGKPDRLETRTIWQELAGEGKALRYGLMRGWCVDLEMRRDSDASGQDGRQRFCELFERAFGASIRASVPNSGNSKTESSTAAGLKSNSALPEVRAAAEAAWERLEVFRRQAEQEAERLKQVLEQAIAARAVTPSLASLAHSKRELAGKILNVFARHQEALGTALKLDERLSGAFYKLLTARHGARARFAHFDPARRPKTRQEDETGWLGAAVQVAARRESLDWLKSHSPPASAPSNSSEAQTLRPETTTDK
jgi:hypothetical protein